MRLFFESAIILIALAVIEVGAAYSVACDSASDNISAANKSNPSEWLDKGNALRKMGMYDEAINAYNRAIDLNPELAEPWYNNGVALFDQGRYNESIEAYDRAIDLNPKWALPWYGKGKSLDQLGLHEDALEAYDVAVELNLASAKQKSDKG